MKNNGIDLANRLLKIQEKIKDVKEEKIILETKLHSVSERLKEIGCDTIEQAQKKIEKLEEDITMLQKEINSGIDELEEIYEED